MQPSLFHVREVVQLSMIEGLDRFRPGWRTIHKISRG
jgi:hypothetical protein